MPQIAQQDYKIIQTNPDLGAIGNDANALLQLLKAVKRGTIFDVIVEHVGLSRIVYADSEQVGLAFSDGIAPIELIYSESQYEGLAAVQTAMLAVGLPPAGLLYELLQYQSVGNYNVLGVAANNGNTIPILDEDGHAYLVQYDGDDFRITSISKSTVLPDYDTWDEGAIVLPFEAIEKLVGLHVQEI